MSYFWFIYTGLFSLVLPFSETSLGAYIFDPPPHVVFLVSEDPDNYNANQTIPSFAAQVKRELGYEVTVLLGTGKQNAYEFPDFDKLKKADVVVVFARRLALPHKQMKLLRKYIKKGKPVVGIRTANHAFSVREGAIPPTHTDWWEFVPEVLGCENRGYGPVGPGIHVKVPRDTQKHPLVKDLVLDEWHSDGNLYLVAPLLDEKATILLEGESDGKKEPIAWTRMAGRSRVFYTSLGYPKDFSDVQFQQLLLNGIQWALEEK